MKIGICSALACKLDDSLKYIGVDHGVEILLKQGIKPVFAIGDFDSIENENVLSELDIERLPTRKDVTDTHAALEYAYIDIDGAEYPLNQYFLQRQDPLCVSNQVSCEIATITNSKPIVLVKSKDA